MILIHKICIAFKGDGKPKAVATLAMVNAAKEVESWKAKKERILKKIPLIRSKDQHKLSDHDTIY